ncbi:MAG: hypothetical protein ABJB16_01905 [Saprospiraceae bacterium]
MMHTRFILFGFVLLFFTSCVKDKVEVPVDDHSVEYFPLQIGRYIVYSLDSVVFDDASGGNIKDTVSFQIKEEVSGYQIALSGDTLFYLHRSRRNTPEENWTVTDVWTASRSSTEATRTEENLKFRKMTFPLRYRKKWSTTSYIPTSTTIIVGTEMMQPYQDWDSEVVDFDVADQVGTFSFADGEVMHVSQSDIDDGSIKRYVYEKYVRNIGLVARTDSILDSRCFALGDFTECIGKTWLEQAGKGYILSQVMIDHN